jgi:hypothetical protein
MKKLALVTLVALIAVACDDKNAVSPSVQQAAVKAQAEGDKTPSHPTTQELLTGPRKRLTLAPVPFSASVPLPWKLENLASGAVLAGPTPSGEVQIQLSSRTSVKKEDLDIVQRAAKKELAATQPAIKRVLKAELKKLPNSAAQVFERQAIGQPAPLIVTDANNHEHTETATPFDWTLTLYVPNGTDFARYELNFIGGLTAEQYKQDQQLLEAILSSLIYEPSAATPPPAAAPTTKPI